MKTILILFTLIVVSMSKDIPQDPQIIKNCLKNILETASQKNPEMKDLLDAHQKPFFELVDKYFECCAEPVLHTVPCNLELEITAALFRAELQQNVPNEYKQQLNELMKAGKQCIFGDESEFQLTQFT